VGQGGFGFDQGARLFVRMVEKIDSYIPNSQPLLAKRLIVAPVPMPTS